MATTEERIAQLERQLQAQQQLQAELLERNRLLEEERAHLAAAAASASSSSQNQLHQSHHRIRTYQQQQQQQRLRPDDRVRAEALTASLLPAGMLRPELFDQRAAADQRRRMGGGRRTDAAAAATANDPDEGATVGISDADMEALRAMGYGIFAPGNPALDPSPKKTEPQQSLNEFELERELLKKRRRDATEAVLREQIASGRLPSSSSSSLLPPGARLPPHQQLLNQKRRIFGIETAKLFRVAVVVLVVGLWNARRMIDILLAPDAEARQ